MANKKAETKKMLKSMEARRQMSMDYKNWQYVEEINGKEYVFQYPGNRKITQISDESKNDKGVVSNEKLMDKLLKTIVVNRDIDLDSFDLEEYFDDKARVQEIVGIIGSGNFRHNSKLKKGKAILPRES